MKIAIILGTRPEIIKLSSIIRYCKEQNLDYYILHTNQHYSPEMDKVFFEELKLPAPKYNLGVGSGKPGEQFSKMFIGIEEILIKDRPEIIIVQGDTNTVFAGAFVASRLGIKIAHVEAGLRSYDRNMPEEVNRILTDNIADLFFCPTEKQKEILNGEKITTHVYVVGNTIVDAIRWAEKNETEVLSKYSLEKENYLLLTLHRAENVDQKRRLQSIIDYISKIKKEKIIFPIHPRTRKMLDQFKITLPANVEVLPPLGFLDMIVLEKNSKLILTDSGGIQEEACILKRLCITLRDNTERPETLDVGGNILMKKDILEDYSLLKSRRILWYNPFGDGKSGKKIIDTILKIFIKTID